MPTFLVSAHEQPAVLDSAAECLAPFPVVVHVDARVNVRPFHMIAARRTNVRLVRRRIPVSWAGFSQCEVTFELLREGLAITPPGEYLVQLTGTCHLARPVRELVAHLDASGTTQMIRYLRAADFPDVFVPQLAARHHRDDWWVPGGSARARRLNRKIADLRSAIASVHPRVEPPKGVDIHVGQAVWALTTECAADVLGRRTEELDSYFRGVFAPDEKYVHTLVASSEWNHLTMRGGAEHPNCPDTPSMAPLHWIPRVIGRRVVDSDWPLIEASDAFFVRKIGLPESAGVLERLRARSLGPCEVGG